MGSIRRFLEEGRALVPAPSERDSPVCWITTYNRACKDCISEAPFQKEVLGNGPANFSEV